jgi:hypothetical protein
LIKEIEISVPTSYSDISLKKWLDLQKEMKNYEGDTEAVTALILYHLCGLQLEYIKGLSMDGYSQIKNELASFMQNVELPLQRFITIDGVEYGFITSWKKMSFGEFADLDTLMTKKPEEFLNYLHIITAILYRPITKYKGKHKFEIEEYNVHTMEERAELFKNKLNVEYALGSQFFFIHFARTFSQNTPISSKMWMKISWMQIKFVWRWRKKIWTNLWKKNSDGTWFLTELQVMILQDTIASLRKVLSKP